MARALHWFGALGDPKSQQGACQVWVRQPNVAILAWMKFRLRVTFRAEAAHKHELRSKPQIFQSIELHIGHSHCGDQHWASAAHISGLPFPPWREQSFPEFTILLSLSPKTTLKFNQTVSMAKAGFRLTGFIGQWPIYLTPFPGSCS